MEYGVSMTQRQSLAALLAQVGVAFAVLIGATVLCGMDKINGEALTAIYGAAIGLAAAGAASTTAAAINGGPKPDLTQLAAQSPEIAERLTGAQVPQPPSAAEREHRA